MNLTDIRSVLLWGGTLPFCSNLQSGDIEWHWEVKPIMDEYYRLAAALPVPLCEGLQRLDPRRASTIQEIRLRAGQPVQFTVHGSLVPAAQFLPENTCPVQLSPADLQECFLHLCDHSVYAYEEELRQGFFTILNGDRVGVAGIWSGSGFSRVTSLNLRVARWVTCPLPDAVREYLLYGYEGLLVAGVPGSGKTTFLRTLIQHLSRSAQIVCVVDERGELLAGGCESLSKPEQIQCDVYTRCPKAEAICMALRCMNPATIVCDELGTPADVAAVEQGVASGARFLASVHCDTPEGLREKPQLARLLQTGAFRRAVFLDGRSRPGMVAQWVELA